MTDKLPRLTANFAIVDGTGRALANFQRLWDALASRLENAIDAFAAALAAAVPQASSAWNPSDASGASLTLTITHARAIRFGAFEYITGTVTYPTTANGSAAKIGGLPVAAFNQAGVGGAFVAYRGGGSPFVGILGANSTVISIFDLSGATVANSALSTETLRFQFFYPVA